VGRTGEFQALGSCPTATEEGEIEDYLVLLDYNQKLQAPNFITPNDDGQNDYLIIKGLDAPSESAGISNELTIYSRSGELVYRNKNYANDFKGNNSSGETLKDGTYYFVLTQKYKLGDDTKEDYLKGFFELRR
jgi:gliding motility-associated-like protein